MFASIYHAVVYIAVPAIMLSMLALSVYIMLRAPQGFRMSAVAGFSAGLVAFAIYVFSSFSDFRSPTLGLDAIPTFKWLPIVIGAAVGFGLLLLGGLLEILRPGLVGLFVLFLAATSSTAAFSYFFASPLRADSIYLALGCLFGLLVYVVLFPGNVREAFPR